MTNADREKAHRMRKYAIGVLECCRCDYPVRRHATVTFHHESCPAHGMVQSAMATGDYNHFEWKPSP